MLLIAFEVVAVPKECGRESRPLGVGGMLRRKEEIVDEI